MKTHSLHHPANVRVKSGDSTLIIRLSWFYWRYVFAFIIVSVLSIFLYTQFKVEIHDPNAWPLIYTMIPLYVGFFYYLLTKLINHTEISVDRDRVTIRHKPLPFRKGLSIVSKNTNDVVVNEKTYQGRTKRDYYEICVANEHKSYVIATYIEDYNQAEYIQRLLNSFFNSLS